MKGNLTISRPTYGNGKEKIRISIRDQLSRNQFLEIEVGYAEFATILTGLSEVEVDFQVNNLENVGKTRVTESRKVTYPGQSYDRNKLEDWLKENCKEEGWKVIPYLGSQNSRSYENGKTILNYSVEKYVDESGVTE